VVVVGLDQLRGDLLERYDPLFTGGFRRLHDGGVRFVNATHDHSGTETAVGHVTLATGVYPSRHGIVANDWYVRREGRMVETYCMEDGGSPVLGFPSLEGRSPRSIERSGLAEWIQDAHPGARVVSISRKDRSAIGLATRAQGHVYWIIESAGVFTTSAFYRTDLPDWVKRFNTQEMPRIYSDSVWSSTVPPDEAWRSRPDTSEFEFDGVHTSFPHDARLETNLEREGRFLSWAADTPAADRAVLGLAATAVGALGLGARDAPDYLAISLSQADAIGHAYGPLSREQMDNLLRADRELGRFMDFLDSTLGPERWVMALSSDHGAMDVPETTDWARRVTREQRSALNDAVVGAVNRGGDREAVRLRVERGVSALDWVDAVIRYEDLRASWPADSILTLHRNGYFEDRHHDGLGMLDMTFRPAYGFLNRSSATGTSHGTPWHHDRWVPLVFYGPGVPEGIREERAATVDMAPTLAALAGVAVPEDLDGRNLLAPTSER
jgi:predicted AlkP superfamily pyrophosphatase or phosphodiesterase